MIFVQPYCRRGFAQRRRQKVFTAARYRFIVSLPQTAGPIVRRVACQTVGTSLSGAMP